MPFHFPHARSYCIVFSLIGPPLMVFSAQNQVSRLFRFAVFSFKPAFAPSRLKNGHTEALMCQVSTCVGSHVSSKKHEAQRKHEV